MSTGKFEVVPSKTLNFSDDDKSARVAVMVTSNAVEGRFVTFSILVSDENSQ
jgi:hypothetical protein